MGNDHTVALKSDRTLWAWGYNYYGQLGDGTNNKRNTPTQESTASTNWSAIATSGNHTVALKSDGTLWAWGRNHWGQLGDGTTTIKTIPTQESTEANDWSAIAAGANHTVALKTDGTLWAWGSNGDGQLGDGTRADKTVSTQEMTGTSSWSAIAAGWHLTVALRSNGTLWAWGSNNDGQVGNGTSQGEVITPSQESTGATSWSTIAAGDQHALALRSDGSLWAWGENGDRRLGVDTPGNKNNPTQESTKATNWPRSRTCR